MNCLCGYEYESIEKGYDVDFQGRQRPRFEIVKGDEPFIFILGKQEGTQYKGVHEDKITTKTYKIIACPKCRTLKLV